MKMHTYFFFSTGCFLDMKVYLSPNSQSPSDLTKPVNKILPSDVFFMLFLALTEKAYGSYGVPPIVLKNCDSMLTSGQAFLYQLPPFFLAENLFTFIPSLRRVTTLVLKARNP